MKLVKLVDYEGESHFINGRYIISVRPFYGIIRKCKVEYGTGFVDCIYMKELANEVATKITNSCVYTGYLDYDKI